MCEIVRVALCRSCDFHHPGEKVIALFRVFVFYLSPANDFGDEQLLYALDVVNASPGRRQEEAYEPVHPHGKESQYDQRHKDCCHQISANVHLSKHPIIDVPFSVNSVDISSHSSLRQSGKPRKILALTRATKRRIIWYGLTVTQRSIPNVSSALHSPTILFQNSPFG